MSRQYFADVLLDPPTINPLAAAITATVETALWPVALFTPISVGDIRAGKVYQCEAGGIYSTSTSGTLSITPRIGVSATAATNITLGVSGAQAVAVSLTNAAWYLKCTVVIRTVGLAGANSTAIASGFWAGSGTLATAGSGNVIPFGGTVATFDASVSEGLWMGWTLTVAGSCTPQWLVWRSLN